MVQEIDGEDEKDTTDIPRNDRASRNACWICGEVGHYANECPHNLSNIKSRGPKKTSMDKKGGECTYTITGKEPVSERVMNTILNGMMREQRGRLQFQCKYQKLRKAVTSADDSGVASATVVMSPTHKKQDPASKAGNKDKKGKQGQ